MSRITLEEAKKLWIKLKPVKNTIEKLTEIAVYEVRGKLRRKSKYGAERTEIDEIDFASIWEAKRFTELKLLEKVWNIYKLSIQPKFLLQEWFIYNWKKIQNIKYTADFKYKNKWDEKYTIEEFKGSEFQSKKDTSYVLRKKLFLYKYWKQYNFIEKIWDK